MKRGELARRTGMTVEAIRFYENTGVLLPPPRGENGYRTYDHSYVERIALIRHGQQLGFTLAEIRQFFEWRRTPGLDRAVMRERVEAKRAAVDSRIRELQLIRELLTNVIRSCSESGSLDDCLRQFERRVGEPIRAAGVPQPTTARPPRA